jgi:transcriptional regulator with XRE-family HTH domain
MSLDTAGQRAGMSRSQFGRLEHGDVGQPSVEQVCRAARAVGLRPWLKLYPDDLLVRDAAQLALLIRFEELLSPPLRMRREVPMPIGGDLRAWDARISDGERVASVEAVSWFDDAQAVTRRIALKTRDDPDAGAVILLLSRTAHNRAVMAAHRETLRDQFPLDGGAIARSLRAGRVPAVSGILMR